MDRFVKKQFPSKLFSKERLESREKGQGRASKKVVKDAARDSDGNGEELQVDERILITLPADQRGHNSITRSF
jgi:hypothetical protein